MDYKEQLKELEQMLLQASVRKDAERVSWLLAEEFREFGSSGRCFSRAEIVAMLQAEPAAYLSLTDFEASLLADGVALATYRAVKRVPGSLPAESLRSSVWVRRDDRWQMLFHHGTKISGAPRGAHVWTPG